jgi:copper transport protein
VWTPAVRAAGLAASAAADGFRRRFRRALPAAWVVLVVTGVLALVFEAATVSGLSFVQAARPNVLRELLQTAFGHFWEIQMLLALALGLPVFALVGRRPLFGLRPQAWLVVLAVLAGGLAVATALNGHARTLTAPGVMVPALALHLITVGVWVGGLGALVVLGRLGWHQVGPDERPALLRQLIGRFTKVAVVAVIVIALTGVVNAIGDFGAFSDLWRVTHGRVVGAKVVLLAIALALAARHQWRSPRRLAEPATAGAEVSSFERSSAAELVVVAAAVALASALVALVPGRSLALAAKGPVNQERHTGGYTVQLFIDPTQVGADQVHVTFVNDKGLAASEIATSDVKLGIVGTPPQAVAMRLISPGHFVGDTTLPTAGRYQLSVATSAAPGVAATFDFRLRPKE